MTDQSYNNAVDTIRYPQKSLILEAPIAETLKNFNKPAGQITPTNDDTEETHVSKDFKIKEKMT